MTRIDSIVELERLYGEVTAPSRIKVSPRLTATYARLLEASPFCALATSGPEGLDCSPRGDAGACIRIQDETTLLMPDRRGNNRIDSLRNIVRDPRVAVMFLIPGYGNAIRVNGKAYVSADRNLLASFEYQGKQPRSVIVIKIEEVYFQCARAIIRAGLWDEAAKVDPATLPTPGMIMKEIENSFDAETYDASWAERAAKTMW